MCQEILLSMTSSCRLREELSSKMPNESVARPAQKVVPFLRPTHLKQRSDIDKYSHDRPRENNQRKRNDPPCGRQVQISRMMLDAHITHFALVPI